MTGETTSAAEKHVPITSGPHDSESPGSLNRAIGCILLGLQGQGFIFQYSFCLFWGEEIKVEQLECMMSRVAAIVGRMTRGLIDDINQFSHNWQGTRF